MEEENKKGREIFQIGIFEIRVVPEPRPYFDIPFALGILFVVLVQYIFFSITMKDLAALMAIMTVFYFVDVRRAENEVWEVEREIDDEFWENF